MTASLLVELFTEELPPKALVQLGRAFAQNIGKSLGASGLLSPESAIRDYATPRRLAAHITAVLPRGSDKPVEQKLMPLAVARGKDGRASDALRKKLGALGHAELAEQFPEPCDRPDSLIVKTDGKTDAVYLRTLAAGQSLLVALATALEDAVESLPIPKVMSYQLADGVTTVRFVRPAHGLVALHGTEVINVTILGLQAGRVTQGHRFLGARAIEIPAADAYEDALAAHGQVTASFEQRRSDIARLLEQRAGELEAHLGTGYFTLLDEVTALVEAPAVYAGAFDPAFLDVPSECLVLTMRQNQRYFPLFDAAGKLTHRFLIVSNMPLADASQIIDGNERVIRARLADAQFFFETDQRTRLEDRVPALAGIVYHNKLGSQLERSERVRAVAAAVGDAVRADVALCERAARLAKADLSTGMVGEFPELQGVMGRYYALADREDSRVADAIGVQYHPRWIGPSDDSTVALALFIADRAETLVGIWGIGLQPTGEKDPFGLRRAALGLISAFESLAGQEPAHELELAAVLEQAAREFKPGLLAPGTVAAVTDFVYERYRHLLAADADRNAVDAVLALKPPLQQVRRRLEAVLSFGQLAQSASLAAANKRIGNILKKTADSAGQPANPALFAEPAERALAEVIAAIRPDVAARFRSGDYAGALTLFAQARDAVDAFFNDVMVMAEDARLRDNRIALLRELHAMMNQVADLSRLAA